VKWRVRSTLILISWMIGACDTVTESVQTSVENPDAASQYRFAKGLKAVKIHTHTNSGGSFTAPTAVPALTPIPSPWPGYDGGTAQYLPGVSAQTLYDLDGTTTLLKPSWLRDFQLGITSTTASLACATFGGGSGGSPPLVDAPGYYRISERNCSSLANGTGDSGSDPVFFRIILDRDFLKIGSAENLIVQVEYQASGTRPNTNPNSGSISNPEDGLDHLWKIFTNSTLGLGNPGKPFSLFVPPNFAFCSPNGSGAGAGCAGNPSGAPITVRQFMIPLSADPNLSVIQFSRVKGRINATGGVSYVNSFCTSDDSPLCLGVVIRSVTLMRF
jgi:hypothetical protein